ncbi:hypothetical protein BDN71DRAFT_1052146 [Pleurotus eryngii]|uniref:Uncharacterized protein n=1 Tax=Pleurotus eryngii TaxID=5323 RepID=A0A9P5ZVC7_PLEER|nr:hypothetical protein BDN71DRAFT_1052146 [Pleurotus eryngii]
MLRLCVGRRTRAKRRAVTRRWFVLSGSSSLGNKAFTASLHRVGGISSPLTRLKSGAWNKGLTTCIPHYTVSEFSSNLMCGRGYTCRLVNVACLIPSSSRQIYHSTHANANAKCNIPA